MPREGEKVKIEVEIKSMSLLDWQVYVDAIMDGILEVDDSAVMRIQLK